MAEIIMAFAPLVFLIVYALKTRKMADAMILATLLAMVLLHRQHFLTGAIDALYGALSNSSYQFVLCITTGFGGMITLFQESGALMGFRDLLLKAARGPKRTLVLAWVMSAVMFVDEYLNALAVTFSMREITDRNRIPREHLAVQANVMACCLCMTVPFSSWTAFTVGLVSEYGLGFGDYLRAIPYMLYPLCMMLVCLLLAVGAFPKAGVLKRAYRRVESGGPAFERDEKAEKLVDVADVDESRASSAWNAVVPLAVLVGGTIIFDNDLIHGMVLAIIAQFLLYVPQKLMTVGRFFEHFFNGAKGMTSLAIVVCFGFMLSEANRQLGLFDILINGIGSTVPGYLVPPLAFLLVGATVFAVGGCWVVMTIAIPVFVPLALSMGVTAPVIIAAVMSGIGLGLQHLLLRRRSVYDHSGHRRVQHYHHQGHAALCRRRGGGGCGGVPAVRDTGVREPAGRFRREAPLHILYGALTWRAAGDML